MKNNPSPSPGYMRGWQMGAQNLPPLRDWGQPPPWPLKDYLKGHADGSAAYAMAMRNEQYRPIIILQNQEPHAIALTEAGAKQYIAKQADNPASIDTWGMWAAPVVP